mgnify:CR=1 FL=1
MEKKSSKKKVLWVLGILFILLVIIVIIYFVIGYKNDQIESKKKIDSVITSYNNFKTHIDSFNKERDNFYQVVMKDMYYEDLKNNDTKTIEPLEDDYKELKDKCVDVLYPDVSVNNKCEAFVIGYEKAINSYVSDIKKYNENIKDYNDVLEENDTKIEEVKLTIDYIDVDGDRKYLGKN